MPGYNVIESKIWVRDDGLRASRYGACPWTSESEKARWALKSQGWTVQNCWNGETVARAPWATREQAEEFAATHTPSRISIGD